MRSPDDRLSLFPGSGPGAATHAFEAGSADTIHVDDAALIFRGAYGRDGADLVISGGGERLVVHDYFTAAYRPKLVAPNGASLSDAVIEALAGPAHAIEVAQAGTPPVSDASNAIGRVQSLAGTGSVVRNGVTVAIHTGDLVYKGDVLQTDRASALSVSFLDGTLFSLAASARMVMNEMVYEAGGSNNHSLFNLVQGSISFVAGQVAKTGDMKVGTPVSTMGIRGTFVRADVTAEDGTTRHSVLTEPPSPEHPEGRTGRFDIYDRDDPNNLLATVDDPNTVAIIHPKGTAETRVEQVPKTPSELAGEHDLAQTLYRGQIEAPRLPIFTGPSTGGGTSSSTPPNQILPDANPVPGGTGLPGAQDPIVPGSGNAPNGGVPGTVSPPDPTPDPPHAEILANPPVLATAGAPQSQAQPAPVTPTLPPVPVLPSPEPIVVATPEPALPTAPEPEPVVFVPAPTPPAAPRALTLANASAAVVQDEVVAVGSAAKGVLAADGEGIVVVAAHAGEGFDTSLNGAAVTLTGRYGTLTLQPDGSYVYHADHAAALAEGQEANDTFSFSARSGDGATGTATLTVHVTGTEDLPVLDAAPGLTLAEAAQTGGTGLARASGHVGFGDVDLLDTHTAAVSDAPTIVRSSGLALPSGLAATLSGALTAGADDGTHRIDYAFAAAERTFDFLAAGETLSVTYDLRVSDDHGGTAHTPVTVTITGTDDAPTAQAATFRVPSSHVLTGQVTATDVDSPSLTYAAVNGPAHGSLSLAANGQFTYTANAGYDGGDSFTYRANDGTLDSEVATVTLTATNAAPTITGGGASATLTASPVGNLTPQTALAQSYLTAGNSLVNGLGGTSGFGETVLAVGDDNPNYQVDLTSLFGSQALDFFGHTYTSLYVNNNGNITFGSPSSIYVPSAITGSTAAIIAPFFADVDTRGGAAVPTAGGHSTGSDRVYIDEDAANGVLTVTWDDVGYFSSHTDRLDAFQVQLVSLGGGNFDIVYRYEAVNWTAAGSVQAVAGYAAGDGTHYAQLPQSGNAAQLQALPTTIGNTGIAGVYVFQASNGTVSANTTLHTTGTIGFTDADAGDTHSASSSLHGLTSSNGVAIPSAAATALQTALSAQVSQDGSGSSAGTVTWSFALANTAAAFLRAGESLTATYDIRVGDGTATSAPTTVTVTIDGVNDAPTSGGDHAIGVHQGGTVTLNTADLGATDPDNTAGELTYTITANPHGSFTIGSGTATVTSFTQAQIDAGQVVYRNGSTASGTETVTYTLNDGAGGSVNGTLAVAVSVPQLAAPGGVQAASPTSGTTDLTQRQLDAIVQSAIADWAAAGATAAQIAVLAAATYTVTDLSGMTLGQESAGRVAIDADAAGYGWYVDPTPGDNVEFAHAANATGSDLFTEPTLAPAGHYDLLTTVMHEMGHLIGLPDSAAPGDVNDLMNVSLALGERRLPVAADVAAATRAMTSGTDGHPHTAAAQTASSQTASAHTAPSQAASASAGTAPAAGAPTSTEHAAISVADPAHAPFAPAMPAPPGPDQDHATPSAAVATGPDHATPASATADAAQGGSASVQPSSAQPSPDHPVPSTPSQGPAIQGGAMSTSGGDHPAATHDAGAPGGGLPTAVSHATTGADTGTPIGPVAAGADHATTGQPVTTGSVSLPTAQAAGGQGASADPSHAASPTVTTAPGQADAAHAAADHDVFVFTQAPSTGPASSSVQTATGPVPSHAALDPIVLPDATPHTAGDHVAPAALHDSPDPIDLTGHDHVAQVAALQLHT